ncbi:MAG TPA: phenylalanine--tRNA ligase subunit beta [Rectinemataceae bacterium]|nr:phenylalanine--tRNA ligase subunit beta [Rectinemataceae bacterium]
MPKIEVNERLFFSLIGRRCGRDELEELLTGAKAELDEWDLGAGAAGDSAGDETRTIKIELNDTNRPDLWSTAGLARQLRVREDHRNGLKRRPDYPFFSREGDMKKGTRKVIVEQSVKDSRPFLAGFVVSGKEISDALLRDMIQTQEKLCWNFGRKRRTVSMGLYRTTIIQWPVRYRAVRPDSVRFVPLQWDRPMNLSEILAEHPKGKEYAFINEKLALHPLLVDSKDAVLSYPPIINSADLGAVQVGDSEMFVELTGTDLASVTLAASIVACDFADAGYKVEPVTVEYPYDTPFGREITFPYYFQTPVSVEAAKASRLLGKSLNVQAVSEALERMGCETEIHGQYVTVFPPEYRNDFLHPVDAIEDVMMGKDLSFFEPERPHDFTIGRLSPIEAFSRRAKGLLVGLGYQEMIYNYLGSGKDYIERMGIDGADVVRISNPMSENFEYLRNSPLPSLLGSEAVSSRAAYPHRIFEVGKVAFRKASENHGVSTRQRLGFLLAHAAADYNEAASHVSTLFFYLGREYSIAEGEDPRFIAGRQASVMYKGEAVGVFGELHPRVLEAWGIATPCAAGEIDLESLLGL